MKFEPITIEVIGAIAAGHLVCLKAAAQRLGIHYLTGRRRILRECLPIWSLRGRRYVRVADLNNPALQIP